MTTELTVTTGQDAENRPLVTFAGEVDVTNVDRFEAVLGAAADRADAVVADVTSLTYLDSAGIEVLFATARRAELEIVTGPGCVVRRVLEVVGLDEVVKLSARPPAT